MEYYLAIKNNEIMPFVGTCMGPEIVILDEVSKRNTIWYCLHVQSKKKWYKWTYLQNRNTVTDVKKINYGYQGGKDG